MKSLVSTFTFYCVLLLALAGRAALAADPTPLNPDLETFNIVVRAVWKEQTSEKEQRPSVEIGGTEYLPPEVLKASQQEFTFLKIVDELKEAREKFGTEYDEKSGRFIFAFDDGRSALPIQKAAIGILYQGKIYLVDGHHKVLISLYMNAQTVPVKVIDDWSDLSERDFRRKMVEYGYAYPLDRNGQPTNEFSDFDEMTDNNNLFLARLIIQKVKGGIEIERFNFYSVTGASHPLILKFNEGLPFIEYFIASLLAKNDIFYNPEWQREIPKKVRKRIYELLKTEVKKSSSPLQNAILVDKNNEITTRDPKENDIRLGLIFKHFKKTVDCKAFLSPNYKIGTID